MARECHARARRLRHRRRGPSIPLALRVQARVPLLRDLAARIFGLGVRPVRVGPASEASPAGFPFAQATCSGWCVGSAWAVCLVRTPFLPHSDSRGTTNNRDTYGRCRRAGTSRRAKEGGHDACLTHNPDAQGHDHDHVAPHGRRLRAGRAVSSAMACLSLLTTRRYPGACPWRNHTRLRLNEGSTDDYLYSEKRLAPWRASGWTYSKRYSTRTLSGNWKR
jgi:hypothetical protein